MQQNQVVILPQIVYLSIAASSIIDDFAVTRSDNVISNNPAVEYLIDGTSTTYVSLLPDPTEPFPEPIFMNQSIVKAGKLDQVLFSFNTKPLSLLQYQITSSNTIELKLLFE